MHFNKGKAYGRQGKAPKGVKFAEALLLSVLTPVITEIGNRSLATGFIPQCLKTAHKFDRCSRRVVLTMKTSRTLDESVSSVYF